VTVDGERHSAQLGAAPPHVVDERGVLLRKRVADRVGKVHDGRAGADHRAADPRDEHRVGTCRVLAGELDLVDATARITDCPGSLCRDLVRGEPQLLLHVDRARRQEDVQARASCVSKRVGARVEVLTARAAERRDSCAPGNRGHGADPFEVAGGGRCKARLDHVDPEPLELLRDLHLLLRPQRDARRLLAVSKRRVENLDPARTHYNLLSGHA